MNENALRDEICELGRSIFERGLTHGSTGNISARCDDGWLLTPTGSNLARLDPARLAKLDWQGKPISGDQPSKENFLHLAMYQAVSYTHLRAHETRHDLVCRLLLEKKKKKT